MHIDILTLFPEMMEGTLENSILKRAKDKKQFNYEFVNFREYSENKHEKVDDYPYGGGAGMVLTAQPIFDAVDAVKQKRNSKSRVILMCPQGEKYTQQKAEELAKEDHLIIICGHYEGYDERIREYVVTDEISIGDYILTGGEIGALAVIDSVVRLIPDVLGNEASVVEDSFSTGLLEHPHYTRPADFRGMKVPEVLLQGNHAKIDEWRKKESLRRTWKRRPDLLKQIELSNTDQQLLQEVISEEKAEGNTN